MKKSTLITPPSGQAQVDPAAASVASPPPQRELSGRLAGLSLPRQVVALSLWPFLEQLLNFTVGTVDVTLAGHLKPESLAVNASNALGVAGYVGWLIGLLHGAVGVGSTALIARAIGAKHRGLAHAAVAQSLLLALGMGLFSLALVYLGADALGHLVGAKGPSLEFSSLYLRIIALATPASAVLFVGAACLRGAGDTRTPFFVMLLVNAVNASASVAFVYAPAPIGGHGVAGIAAGTLLAWYVGVAVILLVLLRGWGGIRLYVHRLRPHAHTLRRIIRVGLPNLFESLGLWSGNFLILRIVAATGSPAALGAHLIAVRIEAVSYLPGYAMGIASATLVGQYLGLGDPRRARQAALLCWAIGAGFMTCLGVLFIAVPEQLVRLITEAAPLLELSPQLLRITGFVQFFFGSAMVFSFSLRGAGDTRAAMVLTYFCTYVVRLPAAWLLGIHFGLGLRGVWLALCGELVLRGCLFAARFFQGAWVRARV
ncbi:MAG: MATE family efflux transporter [Phycisphaeraceae bacterium]|nr:MATE family efflux transporter [Phycisphaeraceae bacterium]